MNDPSPNRKGSSVLALLLVLAGLALVAGGWLLPVNLKSLDPVLLQRAGAGTTSLVELGARYLEADESGPARWLAQSASELSLEEAASLDKAVEDFARRNPAVAAWGGWDPFVEQAFGGNLPVAATGSPDRAALPHFLPERARASLRAYLENSRSSGVQSILQTRTLSSTTRFIPTGRPGGQAYEGVVLLAALLCQGEHLSPSLLREMRAVADQAAATGETEELETFYLDLLSLGKRLDWSTLAEVLSLSPDLRTIGRVTHLAKVAPDQLTRLVSGILLSGDPTAVADYLIQYGSEGAADLGQALAAGEGAVRQLLVRQVPVHASAGPGLDFAARFAVIHPTWMLVLKYALFLLGGYLVFRGIDRRLFAAAASAAPDRALPRVKSGAIAVLFALVLITLSEPFLLQASPISEYRIQLVVPVLSNLADDATLHYTPAVTTMDFSTIISIIVFALLQVLVYVICLLRISDIDRQSIPTLLKLRLMENEENLFDSGLYVGIAGTAAALVLQVLGVIEPNLLAAYSSNLFGITCVALVKIRHVRPYKRRLIIDSQADLESEIRMRSAAGVRV